MPQEKQSHKCYSYIRFSTEKQRKGDSYNRQLKLSEDYAKRHGLYLDKTLRLYDPARSAYTGEHTSKGALGTFLSLAKNGHLPKGSILLVESLDRLSREQVLDAFRQFTDIIKQGISIVTLIDGQEYSEETLNNNFNQLLISLSIMCRAHEESLTKSKRLRAAWKAKRKNIKNLKLTKTGPLWLKLNKEKTQFIKIPERVKIIEQIFDMYLSGKGTNTIATQFNREKLKPWGRSKSGWHTSYMKKVLANRAVIGEFQPHRRVEGKHIPVGEPMLDYYPKIIDQSTFYQVQEKLDRNRKFKGKNSQVFNLFGGLIKCGYCGTSIAFVNKGKPPKNNHVLVCNYARRGGCIYRSVRYDAFEKAILEYCIGLDVEDLLDHDQDRNAKLRITREELDGVVGHINQIVRETQNLIQAIANTGDERVQKDLDSTLTDRYNQRDGLAAKQTALKRKISELSQFKDRTDNNLTEIKQLYHHMRQLEGDELMDLRLRIRNRLRDLIEYITIFPAGYTKELIDREMETMTVMFPDEPFSAKDKAKVRKKLEIGLDNRKYRKFKILFKGGVIREISPEGEGVSDIEYSKTTPFIEEGIMYSMI